jgi:hypothetical protein
MSQNILSTMPDATIADLTEVSTSMQRYIAATDSESQRVAFDAMNRRGLLKRLFPNEAEREMQRIAVDSQRQMAAAKTELMATYTQAQLEIARKQADSLVAAQGMHMQAQLTAFANEKIQDMNRILNSSRENFLAAMEPQFELIKRYEHRRALFEPAERSVLQQIEAYFGSHKTLLDGFTESLHRRVQTMG